MLRSERDHAGQVLEYDGARFEQNSLVMVGCTGGKGAV
jgi:hypothetical protein